MKAATRLLATVQRSTPQFLEPGAPTGLTGLLTHPHPRSVLLYHYNSTLGKLALFPEHSVYRQSTETLTKHRMAIVEAAKPAGLEEWQSRVAPLVEKYPEAFRKIPSVSKDGGFNIVWKPGVVEKSSEEQSISDFRAPAIYQGVTTEDEKVDQGRLLAHDKTAALAAIPHIEAEPRLTAEQIGEIENKIGAGLIEEVIDVAAGESALADTLLKSQVWEDLEEKPEGNQWHYHERDTHTKGTQAP